MEDFGVVIARVIAELTMLIESTLAKWVNITTVDGNITSITMTPLGDSFADAWSKFIVSYAWAMDQMLRTLWSTTSGG
jgi:hypothetical protein